MPGFSWLSRETLLLANNIVLVVIMVTVLLGTLYPLIADALGWGKISVGPPYFNFFFLPLMGLLCLMMALGPLANWKQNSGARMRELLWRPWLLSLIFGLIFPWFYHETYSWLAALAVFLASWIVTTLIVDIKNKLRNSENISKGLGKLTLSYYAMIIAHTGIAVTLIGVSLTSIYNELRDLRMDINQPVQVAAYEFTLQKVYRIQGPNYMADEALVAVTENGKFVREMKPQKRRYIARGQIMTEVALDPGFFRDLYLAMGEPLEDGAWAMRVHIKPFVRWIWLGALMMAFGASLAVADKRYRKIKSAAHKTAAQPVGAQQ